MTKNLFISILAGLIVFAMTVGQVDIRLRIKSEISGTYMEIAITFGSEAPPAKQVASASPKKGSEPETTKS